MPSRAARRRRRARFATLLACLLALSAPRSSAAPSPAPTPAPPVAHRAKTPTLRLSAGFSPERLGHGTAVSVGVRLLYPPQATPLPVTELQLLYPAGLGVGTSDLGLATCSPAALAARGPAACPRDSLMGTGKALVKVPFGPHEVNERAPITIFSQPVREGHAGLLFSVSGDFPVIAELAFGAFLLPGSAGFGGTIDTLLPLVPSVPGGPDVALVALQTTLGGRQIVYSERVRGRMVRFHPEGVLLPSRCPRGGFRFAARVTLADGSRASGSAAVPCPGT